MDKKTVDKKSKWISFGISMVIVILLRVLLRKWGIELSYETSIWFFLFLASWFLTSTVIEEKYRGYVRMISIIFLSFTITTYAQNIKELKRIEKLDDWANASYKKAELD